MLDKSAPSSKVGRDSKPSWNVPLPGRLVERYALLALLIVLIVTFTILPKTGSVFLSSGNVQYLLTNQSVTALIAIGMVVPLIAGYFDLANPAIAGFSAVATAALLCNVRTSTPVALILAVAAGPLLGAVNGFLCAVVKLNALITTLATYTLLGGLLLAYTQGQQIAQGFPQNLGDWTLQKTLGLPNPFWLLVVLAVVLWYVTTQTPFGRKLTAVGSNESAARLAGIRVNRLVFISFVISGALGGVAGTLLAVRTGGADATAGQSFLFPAMAAVFLGQTAFTPGRYNVWGTVTGVFVVAVAVNGLSLLGAESWVQPVFNGAALLLSVAISTLTSRVRHRRAAHALLESGSNDAGSPPPAAGASGSPEPESERGASAIAGR